MAHLMHYTYLPACAVLGWFSSLVPVMFPLRDVKSSPHFSHRVCRAAVHAREHLKIMFHASSVIRRGTFTLQNNSKNLDLSYKTDLDFWNCFGREKQSTDLDFWNCFGRDKQSHVK